MSDRPIHPAALDDDTLMSQCKAGTSRSSGPGGQHRNKVETAVTLSHQPTGISAQASERRSQVENKKVALRRLRIQLAIAHRCPPPRSTGLDEIASDLWRSRRNGDRLRCNRENKDYPALLAEAMDTLSDSKWDPKKAGLRLGITATQLIKLCQGSRAAMTTINASRKELGLHALR